MGNIISRFLILFWGIFMILTVTDILKTVF
jgi:hypothetical protein